MKVIAYSQVPQKSSYIHLAYLSASQPSIDGPLGSGALMGIVLVMIYLAGSALKINVNHPRAWRWFLLCSVTAAVLALLLISYHRTPMWYRTLG
jgi:hypothetical protein